MPAVHRGGRCREDGECPTLDRAVVTTPAPNQSEHRLRRLIPAQRQQPFPPPRSTTSPYPDLPARAPGPHQPRQTSARCVPRDPAVDRPRIPCRRVSRTEESTPREAAPEGERRDPAADW